ncbi:hypothetical protein KYI11_10905 [Macrococcoides bohemicum]|uniref:Uncharacterized protein n=1 Tax=Macrococcoides bohemicum TaxID=1903056 RepID=A0AAJ4P7T1_9STAP|nr:hypothetical protein [Macrococcus bohemicus]QYA42092.1 hypothetical protein KYI11_10905 [Macrococcus bohemicus]
MAKKLTPYELFITELYGFNREFENSSEYVTKRYKNYHLVIVKEQGLYILKVSLIEGGFSKETASTDLSKLISDGIEYIDWCVHYG